MRVLVVDANHDTARMMRRLLKAEGYEVKLAMAPFGASRTDSD